MKPTTREIFVKTYSPFINEVVKGTGILPGTLIAQALIESSGKYKTNGQWLVGGSKLSQVANNFFGIKASKGWKGDVYNITTGEYTPSGSYYEIADNFRKYPSVEASIKDYVNFLISNPRYHKAGVFEAKTVKDQAEALKRAGYATAPNYADMISKVYESAKGWISSNPIKSASIGGIGLILAFFLAYKLIKK